MTETATTQLQKLNELDEKLINVLRNVADILDSATSLSNPTDAQNLVNQKPEEFSNLLHSIRNDFFQVIETAPKPGIPYYDPKPLAELKKSLNLDNSMTDE